MSVGTDFGFAKQVEEMGKLAFEDGRFRFEGDADKSAIALLDTLQSQFDGRYARLLDIERAARNVLEWADTNYVVKGCNCNRCMVFHTLRGALGTYDTACTAGTLEERGVTIQFC